MKTYRLRSGFSLPDGATIETYVDELDRIFAADGWLLLPLEHFAIDHKERTAYERDRRPLEIPATLEGKATPEGKSNAMHYVSTGRINYIRLAIEVLEEKTSLAQR